MHRLEAGLTSEPIISSSSAETGPAAGLAAADCWHTQRVVSSITDSHPWWTALGRNTKQLLSHCECSSPAYLTTGEQNIPCNKAVTAKEQRWGPVQHPVQAVVTITPNTPPIKGTIRGQHTLGKDMASICTKNIPHTKNNGLTQSTQGCSHIKTALQDYSR